MTRARLQPERRNVNTRRESLMTRAILLIRNLDLNGDRVDDAREQAP